MRAQCYVFTLWQPGIHPAGLPHSEIHGSKRICRYPCLIAACRVLHRLLAPRHSSCALRSLINLFLQQSSEEDRSGNSFMITDSSLATMRWPRQNQTQHYLLTSKLYLLPCMQMSKNQPDLQYVVRRGLVSEVSLFLQTRKRSFCFSFPCDSLIRPL